MHAAEVGHLCSEWENGDQTTTDWRYVTCGECKAHAGPLDPEGGTYGTRFGEECPGCGEPLPPIEDGNEGSCPGCDARFIGITIHMVIPLSDEALDCGEIARMLDESDG